MCTGLCGEFRDTKTTMIDKQKASTVSPTPNVIDSVLHEQIKTIRGIDAEMGIRNLKYDVYTYLQLLRMLGINHGDDMHKLTSHLANDEIEEAQILAHNLGGSASMLYLVSLQEAAYILEGHLGTPGIDKHSRILRESTSKVQRELTDVLADIARIK